MCQCGMWATSAAVVMIACLFTAVHGSVDERKHYVLVRQERTGGSFDKRSEASTLPDELTYSLTANGDHVTLRLKRNHVINHNAPVTFTDGSTAGPGSYIKDVGVYQDFSKRASISISSHYSNGKHVRSLEGSFVSNGKYYEIAPTEGAVKDLLLVLQRRNLENNYEVPHLLTEKKFIIPGAKRYSHDPIDITVRSKGNKAKPQVKVKAPPAKKIESRSKHEMSKEDVVSRLLELLTRGRSRERRAATKVYVYSVEVQLLLDHTIWERFMELANNNEDDALKRLKYHFGHILNGIDLAYSSIDGAENGFTVEVFLKGYTIDKTKTDSLLTVPYIMGKASGTEYRNIGIKGNDVLDAMNRWHEMGGRTWYNPDHAMLFTRYNIDKSSTIGLAPLGGISSNAANSLVEEIGFHTWITAAHELGHNLGAEHDGDDNKCNGDKQYIMAPSGGSVDAENIYNVYTFSKCSIKEMKNILMGLTKDTFPAVSLHNRVCSHTEMVKDSLFPGARHNTTQQCQTRYGLDSKQCEENGEDICRILHCLDQNSDCSDWGPGAADGTPCGENKWCMRVQCVTKTTVNENGGNTETCTETNLEITPPDGCADKPNYSIELQHQDDTKTTEYCDTLFLKEPSFCFTDATLYTACCASCHKLGLVKNARPVSVDITPAATTTTEEPASSTTMPPVTETTEPSVSSTTTHPTTTEHSTTQESETKMSTFGRQGIATTSSVVELATTSPPGSAKCRDRERNEDCELWKSYGDCENEDWKDWMAKECAKTCGRCKETAKCRDKEDKEDCEHWKSYGDCEYYKKWMSRRCAKTCGFCKDLDCRDKQQSSHCEYWKGKGFCQKRFTAWMEKNCRKTCGHCQG